MDKEDSIELKCENLMNQVVESRRHFKKMCKNYHQKCFIMENQLLKLQTDTYANISFKSKCPIPNVDSGTSEIEDFLIESLDRNRRMEDLKERIRNTQAVVMQLRADKVGKILREPLNPEAMLAHAKQNKL